ncbi:MAG: T9SS type A sorting domain-containing protein, partial [Flavobacteriales bacterium]
NEYAVLIGSNESAMGAFFESFETQEGENLFPYFTANYDNNHTFFRRYTGGGHTGSACAMLNSGDRNQLDLLDPNNENDIDELVTPLVNLSGISSAVLAFRWSYSTQTNTDSLISEKLQVFRSTDCGRTWTQLPGELNGTDLVNAGNDASMPPTQWSLKTITLPASVLTNNVRFRFRFSSGPFANNLFIDDINIATPVGLIDLMGEGFVNVFPNPTNDHFTLQVLGMEDDRTEVVITDLRGAVVYSNVFQPMGGANSELSTRGMGLADGMYMLRASNSLGSSTQKLILGR